MRFYAFWTFIILVTPFILRRPIWGLCLYTVLNIVRPEMLFWGGDQAAKALFFVFAVTMLGHLLGGEFDFGIFFRGHMILTFLVYFGIWCSIWMSEYYNKMAGIYVSEILKVWVFCYLICTLLKTRENFRHYFDAILYPSGFLAVWGVEQYFGGNTRLEGLGGNAFPDSNYIAAHFVMFTPLAIDRALNGNRWWVRLLGAGVALAHVAVIICTSSRGGLLGLVGGVLVFVLTSDKKAKLIPYLIVIVLAISPLLTDEFTGRMQTMTGPTEELDSSATSRLVLWEAAWYVFLDNPVFGAGFMVFPKVKDNYEDRFYHIDETLRLYVFGAPKVQHSTVFQVISEGGLVLAIPFFLLMFGALWNNNVAIMRFHKVKDQFDDRYVDYIKALNAGLVGYFISFMFINALIAVFSYTTIAVCAVIRLKLAMHQRAAKAEAKSGQAQAALSRSSRRASA